DFDAAISIAQHEFDQHRPEVVVGSSRGGAVAMNIDTGSIPLVLLCPTWKRWGTVTTIKPNTVILHSEADEVVPIADSGELLKNSGLPASALMGVGRAAGVAFAREGARVVVVDVAADGGQETVRLIKEAGGESRFLKVDVARAAEVGTLSSQTVAACGRLDCANNKAGIGGAFVS